MASLSVLAPGAEQDLVDALAVGVAERARQTEVPSFQKAREMSGLQRQLRGTGKPHSIRDLARVTRVAPSKVAEQLTIASELSDAMLARHGLQFEDLANAPHAALLRAAKLPPYLRAEPLRNAARVSSADADAEVTTTETPSKSKPTARESKRGALYEQLSADTSVEVVIRGPIPELSRPEAEDLLDVLLPTLARLAELLILPPRSHYVALPGNGGILVYLCPAPDTQAR